MKRRSATGWTLALLFLMNGCVGVEGALLTPIERQAPAPDAGGPDGGQQDRQDGGQLVECTTAVVGSASECTPNMELKAQAMAACASQGMVLDQGGPAELCDAQSARFAKFVCCPEALLGSCTHETQGGPASCASEDAWREQAARSCALSGLWAQSFLLSDACASGYRVVRYLCCPRG